MLWWMPHSCPGTGDTETGLHSAAVTIFPLNIYSLLSIVNILSSLLRSLMQSLLNQGYAQLPDLSWRLPTFHLHQPTNLKQFLIFTIYPSSLQGCYSRELCISPSFTSCRPTQHPTSWPASGMSCRKPRSRIWKAGVSHLIVLCAFFKCTADNTYQKLSQCHEH